jgi:hypothetical protein
MTHHAIPARCKGLDRGVARGPWIGTREETTDTQEGSNGISDQDVKEQRPRKERATGYQQQHQRMEHKRQLLRLESMGNLNKTFWETLRLEIANRIAGASIIQRKMSVSTL